MPACHGLHDGTRRGSCVGGKTDGIATAHRAPMKMKKVKLKISRNTFDVLQLTTGKTEANALGLTGTYPCISGRNLPVGYCKTTSILRVLQLKY